MSESTGAKRLPIPRETLHKLGLATTATADQVIAAVEAHAKSKPAKAPTTVSPLNRARAAVRVAADELYDSVWPSP